MAYSVTGMTAAPDIGFRSESRHTAQGAMDLATRFIVDGLREIEIRDPRGNLQSLRQLERHAERFGGEEAQAARRLAAL